MKRVSSFFTPINLVIVVAIVGILAMVSMQQYQNRVARSQVAEGYRIAEILKTRLTEYQKTHGVFPNRTIDVPAALGYEVNRTATLMYRPISVFTGEYVSGVEVSNDGLGTIRVTFWPTSQHHGKFLRLTPTMIEGAVRFNCTTDIEKSYRPSDCETGTITK